MQNEQTLRIKVRKRVSFEPSYTLENEQFLQGYVLFFLHLVESLGQDGFPSAHSFTKQVHLGCVGCWAMSQVSRSVSIQSC